MTASWLSSAALVTVPSAFEQMAAFYPSAVAVTSPEASFTYSQLNEAANRLAHAIIYRRGTRAEPVALLFDHNAYAVVAILAVLKAGKIYVALNPMDPPARLRSVLEQAGVDVIIAGAGHRAAAQALAASNRHLIVYGEAESTGDYNPSVALSPQQVAGLYFTSGSTGVPKGVPRTHAAICQRVRFEAASNQLSNADRITMIYRTSFGASVADMFGTLCAGGRLCFFDLLRQGLSALPQWLDTEGVTRLHLPIPVYRRLLELLGPDRKLPTLRAVELAGGALFKADVERLWPHVGDTCEVLHRYSTTETTIVSDIKLRRGQSLPEGRLPVGYAAAGREILILDANGCVLPPGSVGEIAVRSAFIAPGYWQRPDLSANVFLEDPDGGERRIYRTGDRGRLSDDGLLYHLGRQDAQVKIRGFRVELDAIDGAIMAIEGVAAAAVAAHPNPQGELELTGYWVPADNSPLTGSSIRAALAANLPAYMIPARFVRVATLPLTATGKVDRRALPQPERSRPSLMVPYIAPRSESELWLAAIWADVLVLEAVGVEDPFLELGGNSLQAAAIVARVQQELDVELSLKTLFEAPTIAAMARVVDEQHPRREADLLAQLLAEIEAEDADG